MIAEANFPENLCVFRVFWGNILEIPLFIMIKTGFNSLALKNNTITDLVSGKKKTYPRAQVVAMTRPISTMPLISRKEAVPQKGTTSKKETTSALIHKKTSS
jgi:hypothetical protein